MIKEGPWNGNRMYDQNNMDEWLTIPEIDSLINALKTKSHSGEERIGFLET